MLDDSPIPRIVLLGDSHLARFRGRSLLDLRAAVMIDVVNRAVGGRNTVDTHRALEAEPLLQGDRPVLSVGTNDLAAWKRVPIEEFDARMAAILELLVGHVAAVLEPPEFDETAQRRTRPDAVRTALDRAPYVESIRRLAHAAGAELISLSGAGLLGPDGVHLSEQGYRALIVEIARSSER